MPAQLEVDDSLERLAWGKRQDDRQVLARLRPAAQRRVLTRHQAPKPGHPGRP